MIDPCRFHFARLLAAALNLPIEILEVVDTFAAGRQIGGAPQRDRKSRAPRRRASVDAARGLTDETWGRVGPSLFAASSFDAATVHQMVDQRDHHAAADDIAESDRY